MNYKNRINSGFAGCTLLAYAHDHCRNREVKLYLLPETDEVVGVDDGTDRWVAPAVASLFSVNVTRIIQDLRDGKGIPSPVPPSPRTARVKLIQPVAAAKPQRVKLLPQEPQEARRSRVALRT